MTPEKVAHQNAGSVDEWREAQEILGGFWESMWETVAHLAVRGNLPPPQVARILVGGQGFPGVLPAFE